MRGKLSNDWGTPQLDEHNTNFGFYQWATSSGLEEKLRALFDGQDVIIYGEWFGPKIQKGVVYSTQKQFRGFVVRRGRTLMPVLEGFELIHDLGLETAPILYDGWPSRSLFDVLKGRPSKIAEYSTEAGDDLGVMPWANTAEGIVIYPALPIMNAHGDWIIAKYKDAKWEERKSQRKNEPVPIDVTENAQAFVDEFATQMRFRHVIQAIRDQGLAVHDRKNMGTILRAYFEDITREGKPEYDQLSKDEQRRASKLVSEAGRIFLQRLFEEAA